MQSVRPRRWMRPSVPIARWVGGLVVHGAVCSWCKCGLLMRHMRFAHAGHGFKKKLFVAGCMRVFASSSLPPGGGRLQKEASQYPAFSGPPWPLVTRSSCSARALLPAGSCWSWPAATWRAQCVKRGCRTKDTQGRPRCPAAAGPEAPAVPERSPERPLLPRPGPGRRGWVLVMAGCCAVPAAAAAAAAAIVAAASGAPAPPAPLCLGVGYFWGSLLSIPRRLRRPACTGTQASKRSKHSACARTGARAAQQGQASAARTRSPLRKS